MDKYFTSFDQFQRYETACRLIQFYKKAGEPICILEVGANEQKNMEKFLPDCNILYTDIALTEAMAQDKAFRAADATNLPFENDSFDFVTGLDVYEHIPKEKREDFWKELYRVAKIGVVAAFPYQADYVAKAEERANSYFKSLSGEDYIWLKEHRENGLPEISDTEQFIRKLGCKFFSLYHGDVELWENMICAHFDTIFVPELIEYKALIDRLYDTNIYDYDTSDQCYRVIYVLAKRKVSEWEKSVQDLWKAGSGEGKTRANDLLKMLDSFKLLKKEYCNLQKENRNFYQYNIPCRDCEEKCGAYGALAANMRGQASVLTQQQAQIVQQSNIIAQQQAELAGQRSMMEQYRIECDNRQLQLDAIISSTCWRMTAPLRRVLDTIRRLRRLGKRTDASPVPFYSPGEPVRILCTPHTIYAARLLRHCLAQAGIPAEIMYSEPEEYDSGVYIVFCAHVFRKMPDKYVAFQMEQTVSSRWLTEEYLERLAHAEAVFDYSAVNLRYFEKMKVLRAKLVYSPIDYLPGYRRDDGPYDCDVLFYGDTEVPRRRRMLDALRERFDVKILCNVYGEELYAQLNRARIVVNIHYYENALLETTRIYEVLSLGRSLVVSERSTDPQEELRLYGIVDFVDAGDAAGLSERIAYWIAHEEERLAAVERNNRLLSERTNSFDRTLGAWLVSNGWISEKQAEHF